MISTAQFKQSKMQSKNLNGEQRLQEAKDKAIQNVNKVLADKLKEIEASNATDQDKLYYEK